MIYLLTIKFKLILLCVEDNCCIINTRVGYCRFSQCLPVCCKAQHYNEPQLHFPKTTERIVIDKIRFILSLSFNTGCTGRGSGVLADNVLVHN